MFRMVNAQNRPRELAPPRTQKTALPETANCQINKTPDMNSLGGQKRRAPPSRPLLLKLVGMCGFEPATPAPEAVVRSANWLISALTYRRGRQPVELLHGRHKGSTPNIRPLNGYREIL